MLPLAMILATALQDTNAESLIQELGSDDVATRERATRELIAAGKNILPRLREAWRNESDPEVKARLRLVLCDLDPWVEGKRLATVPEDVEIEDGDYGIRFKEDGTAVAYIARTALKAGELASSPFYLDKPCKRQLVVNDEMGERMDGIYWHLEGVAFSSDWSVIAYVAYRGNTAFAVFGGKKSKSFDPPFGTAMRLSEDGKRSAYVAARGNQKFVVVDGKEEGKFRFIGLPELSPDGTRVAYSALIGDELLGGDSFVVIDEKRGKSFDCVSDVAFSPDGHRVAYVANRGRKRDYQANLVERGKWRVVVDEKEGEPFDWVEDVTFSPRSDVVAYVAGEDCWFRKKDTDEQGGHWFVVKDGKKGEAFAGLRQLTFSADGKRFAYAASMDSSRQQHMFWGGKWRVIVDGNAGEEFHEVKHLTFSADGKRLAYSARSGSGAFAVINGKKGPELDGEVLAPTFSLDGTRLAYVVRTWSQDGTRAFVMEGDHRSESFDAVIGAPRFSPDGKKVGFGVRIGRELWWKVMDVE